jgi:hypothetical protein
MKKTLVLMIVLIACASLFGTHIQDWENSDLNISFSLSEDKQSIYLTIFNKTSAPIKIIWDEWSITDNSYSSSGVIHSGVKFNEKSNMQSITLIIPNSILSDAIVPKTHILGFSGRFWDIEKFSNKTKTLVITYEINNVKKTETIILDMEEAGKKVDAVLEGNLMFVIIGSTIVGIATILYFIFMNPGR